MSDFLQDLEPALNNLGGSWSVLPIGVRVIVAIYTVYLFTRGNWTVARDCWKLYYALLRAVCCNRLTQAILRAGYRTRPVQAIVRRWQQPSRIARVELQTARVESQLSQLLAVFNGPAKPSTGDPVAEQGTSSPSPAPTACRRRDPRDTSPAVNAPDVR